MRRFDYQGLLQVTVGHDGMTLGRLLVDDAARLRDFISLSLPIAWEMESWPELMRMEERWFRAFYDPALTYAAPTLIAAVEVFFPPACKYFQSLHAGNTGNAPATGAALLENSAHWAESALDYGADDWASGVAYVVGNQVRNTLNGRFYQCITAHTSGGSFDGTKFGILTPFDRYIAYTQPGLTEISEVVWAGSKNRRLFTTAREYQFYLSDKGAQFRDTVASAWIDYSVRCPELTGDVWSSTATYAIGDQVYFSSATVKGNFYTCVTATAAAESPASAAAKWALIELPYIFKNFLVNHAYALWLVADGQVEKSDAFKTTAQNALSREANKLWRRQGQVGRTTIQTR
jgi:hypothetical protein